MNYENYKISRNLVWEVLLREGIRELPVKTSALCRSMGVRLAYGEQMAGSDGFSTIVGPSMYIVVREGLPTARTRFTIAHELGHILLGHVGTCRLVNREPSPTDNPLEQAANVFTSRLLAPACVLWGCGARMPEEIAALCEISMHSARIRAERMALLYQRDKFLSSSLERRGYEQFLPFIRSRRP